MYRFIYSLSTRRKPNAYLTIASCLSVHKLRYYEAREKFWDSTKGAQEQLELRPRASLAS